uniref:Uncharacterized protein n=1 Tax=Rhizophora mucronata TaxID=61149 RepID=A0A2P2L9K5_RHIMU
MHNITGIYYILFSSLNLLCNKKNFGLGYHSLSLSL